MGFRIVAVLLIVAANASGQTRPMPAAEPEPRYDAAASIDMMVIVESQREVPKGSVLAGWHLTVRPESARQGADTIEVFLGPADFIKDFDFTFAKGDRLQVTGSKVKYAGNALILAKDVRRESTTMYLRDARGVPYWRVR
jgi:hypothetical protein